MRRFIHCLGFVSCVLVAPHAAFAAEPAAAANPKTASSKVNRLTADPVAGWRGVKVMPKEGSKVLAVGGKAIADKDLSIPYVVQDVKGQWLWVGDEKKGWVRRSQVVTLDEAPAYYADWIKRDPRSAKAYHQRANAWILKGKLDLAMADAEELLRLEPDAIAFNIRGNLWRAKHQFDKAIPDFNEAIRLDPNYASAYANRGCSWAQKDECDKAIADFDQSLRLDPDFGYAYRHRGMSWKEKQEYAKAIADYNQALRLDPNDASTYGVAALLRSGCRDDHYRDRAKAIQLATKGCEVSGWKNALNVKTLVSAYFTNGDYEQALIYIEKALELLPNDEKFKALKRQLERELAKKPDRYTTN